MMSAARVPRAARLVLGFALMTGALLASVLVFQHNEAVRMGEDQTASLSQVIAEQTTRTLQSVDARLQLASTRLDLLDQAGTLDADSARAMLRAQLQDLPYVRAIWVLGPGGRVMFDSDEATLGLDLSDREYFQVYQRSPATEYFIGPLVRSRTTGSWLLSASRPLRRADGSVRGVITAAVEPGYFEQPWRGIDLGASGAVVLYHRNGQMMVRSPPDEAAMGRNFAQTPLFRQYLPAAPRGVFVRASPVDGVKRVVAYRVLGPYPQLLVAVGSGYDELLAPWRRFALLAGIGWAAGALLAATLTRQLLRQARRREQTEKRFAELAQAMPQIVFTAAAQGGVTFISRRWQEVTGLPPEEAMGVRWRQVLHPDDAEEVVERLGAALDMREQMELEMRLRSRDGAWRWHLLRAVPVPDSDDDRRYAWYGTATDIDDLKRAQASMQAQASLLKIASRLARMGGWSVELASGRVRWSEEAAAILDLPADAEPTMQEVIAMFAPRSLESSLQALQACMDEGKPFDVEVEMVTATGRHVWLRSIGQPLRGADGQVVAIQGAQQDITQRVRMLEEIRELNAGLEGKIALRTGELERQEALFRTLAEQAPLPFWTVDPQGGVTFFSRAWYELAGGAPPQWHGYDWLQLVHPDDVAEVRGNWAQARATGGVYAGTRRLRGRDGAWHTTSYRAVPVRDERGEILFWVGIDADITEMTANAAALRLANEQLQAFAYSVSHDLQSPLQRIQSFARLLEEAVGAGNERGRHYLARIRANADTMTDLIEGLLDLAQVSEVEMIRSAVNLSEMATHILQRLQADHPQRRVAWRVQPHMAASGDLRLLRSVLENLVGNAWKFTAGTSGAQIEVGGVSQRGEFFVRDNGAGFDMAYADRLFGTFQRLHDHDEFPGKGIGLATVARAVTRMGGRVWAEGAPGAGATFWFTLPPA
ncbi:PAS domain-containing protein [Ramlibacter sp. XY19]|uniref:PAS domain-containing protein n=1 Tax=Ramlibacter paludis TaxID=2908000 RepID=UPI0023D98E4E|nr:PAS domain-containing protein [Ramlibacter paludis]MCG2594071.1 PAS domain-containing protein [Ramlibacter paludis]